MKAKEFITERMNISWVRPWVERSIPKKLPGNDTVEWYAKLFKLLNADAEFKKWAEENVKGPISIKPKLIDNPNISMSVLDAEHLVLDNPITHQIVADINVSPGISDADKVARMVNRLSARLTHELNHAHQISNQMAKTDDAEKVFDYNHTVFATKPPAPKNAVEEYYMYMLDNLEKDAWASEIAQDIIHDLGDQAAPNLNSIFKQVEKEEYAVIGSKIVQLHNLNGLYSAIRHYGKFLKQGGPSAWQKVKKEIYGYITR